METFKTNIIQEQRGPQYGPLWPPTIFGIPAKTNAPITAQQLSQATRDFDSLQLDDQIARRKSMPGQLNLVCSPVHHH